MEHINALDDYIKSHDKQALASTGFVDEDWRFVRAYCRGIEKNVGYVEIGGMDFINTEKQAKQFVASCKKHGVKEFVLATHCSNDIDTAWLLQQAGAVIDKVVRITEEDQVFESSDVLSALRFYFPDDFH